MTDSPRPDALRYPWADAPVWAMYAATDEDGASWWFQLNPETAIGYWRLPDVRAEKIAKAGRKCPNWRDSLEARPLPASEAPVAWRAYGPGRWANSWQDGKPTADDLEYSRTRGYAITYAYARAESAAPASVPEGVRELVEALTYYMSQFGQGLEAHGIPFGPTQVDADEKARTALTHPALRAFIGSEK
jgi:hypothetical protein